MRGGLLFLSALISTFNAFSQIPNAGFEVWDSTAGYKVPVGWDNLNATSASANIYTCESDTPGYSGNYYMKLTTKTVTGMGLVPGFAVSGKLDPATHLPLSGFPYSNRPQVLAGRWQYMAYSSYDQGYVAVLLTKWNTTINRRDTIAHTFYPLPGMIMFWQYFTLPLNYLSTASPDSAMIILSSSNATTSPATNFNFLWVDDLVLGDTAALAISHAIPADGAGSVFPNPAKEHVTLSYASLSAGELVIAICDAGGREYRRQRRNVLPGDNKIELPTTDLPKGCYFIRATGVGSVLSRKLIIE